MSNAGEVLQILESHGGSSYFGERVTQLEHALQAAALAEEEQAPDSLVIAALLHDIGHLLHDLGEHIADQGVDDRHEALGEAWLQRYFPAAVTAPVKLHVPAKRYLCSAEPDYLAILSPGSVQSLMLQGGPMTPEEVQHFESRPYWRDGVRLRRWDDAAKVEGLPVPGLEHYRARLQALMDAS